MEIASSSSHAYLPRYFKDIEDLCLTYKFGGVTFVFVFFYFDLVFHPSQQYILVNCLFPFTVKCSPGSSGCYDGSWNGGKCLLHHVQLLW